MRALWAVALLVLVTPTAQASLRVTGFATNLQGSGDDDAFEIMNIGDTPILLEDVVVSDGEGSVQFPANASLAPGANIVVATDYGRFTEAARREPDHWILGDDATMRITDAGFALAQDGDELTLHRAGELVDVVAWGDSSYSGPNWTGPPVNATTTELRWFPRVPGHDSDTKADWEQPQRPRLGWREPELPRFLVATGTAYTAPDRSREVVSQILQSAERSLRLNVYEFRDVGLAEDLLARLRERPDLDVWILVDQSPVGLDAEDRLVRDGILRDLAGAGASVRLMQHGRYAFDHAKYAVVDDRWLLVQSENLVPGAMPPAARDGNRGWGLVVDSPELARSMASVFDDDFALDPFGAREPDDRESSEAPLPVFVSASPEPRLKTASAADFNATLIVGPETLLGPDDPLIAAIGRAREEILVEQLRIAPTWRDASGRDWPNEYLNALLEAARRGVRVRVLLDGHFLDDPGDDNEATVRQLEESGKLLPVESRLMVDPEGGVLHVKGLIIDQRESWVGSMNWNLNSVAQNREVSLLVDAPEFAELFRDAFEHDWDRADRPESTQMPVPATGFLLVAIVIWLAALVRARRER